MSLLVGEGTPQAGAEFAEAMKAAVAPPTVAISGEPAQVVLQPLSARAKVTPPAAGAWNWLLITVPSGSPSNVTTCAFADRDTENASEATRTASRTPGLPDVEPAPRA